MPAHVVVGMQWGDEGKGRVADLLAQDADIVARFAGGDNAGHTVQVGDESFKLHLIPSGVLHQDVVCVLGNGMVINPLKLVEELRVLESRGVDISPDRIRIAENAHIITPIHTALDSAKENQRGAGAIGTTRRGIGPAYMDKVGRMGLRAGLMRDIDRFAEAVKERIVIGNRILTTLYGSIAVDGEAMADELANAAQFLSAYIADTPLLLHRALEDGKRVLCEGAQGTLLDIDHGHYPYVTSSSPTVGGAITGLGIAPKYIDRVTGVAKAYSTRVGSGPFPTELEGDLGNKLRGTGENPWDEYGTTTGRPRRCGWLDTVVLRYAARINGLTDIVLTKLDILSGFEEVSVADSYMCQGELMHEVPGDHLMMARCEPVYETLRGWDDAISDIQQLDDLPGAARDYIDHVQGLVNRPICMVTVGPSRHQFIRVF